LESATEFAFCLSSLKKKKRKKKADEAVSDIQHKKRVESLLCFFVHWENPSYLGDGWHQADF
jgi:hypothetical protein